MPATHHHACIVIISMFSMLPIDVSYDSAPAYFPMGQIVGRLLVQVRKEDITTF